MKKKTKALNLHRETLVRLETGRLEKAVGAATAKPAICCGMSDSCPPPPSADTTCC